MISYANTDEMRQVAIELKRLLHDYTREIESLFYDLGEMTTSHAWVGHNANKYLKYIGKDKNIYINFADNIDSMAREITTVTQSLEYRIVKDKRK